MHEPERGERQLSKILESLALIQPVGRLPLLGMVESNFAHILRGSTAVLISASTHESIVGTADALQQRGIRPVVILIDPVGFGGPEGIRSTEMSLRVRNIAVAMVECGGNIREVLEKGFVMR
jgi:uncharacterized protein (DUF58 family)